MNHEVSPYWVWEKELPPQICNYIIKRSINLEEDKWSRGIAGNDNKDDKEHRKNDVQFWNKSSASGRWSNGIFFSYILNANNCNFDYDLSLTIDLLEQRKPPFYENLKNTVEYASIRNDL